MRRVGESISTTVGVRDAGVRSTSTGAVGCEQGQSDGGPDPTRESCVNPDALAALRDAIASL
jgi:hypothetical protein